ARRFARCAVDADGVAPFGQLLASASELNVVMDCRDVDRLVRLAERPVEDLLCGAQTHPRVLVLDQPLELVDCRRRVPRDVQWPGDVTPRACRASPQRPSWLLSVDPR